MGYDRRTLASRIEYSFPRFVAARKGEAAAQLREGAAYAYGGDLKVRATLEKLRPVTLAIEAAVRFWHSVGKNRLLGDSVKVSDRQFPRIHGLLERAAEALQIERPALYVSPTMSPLKAHTLGTSDDAAIVLGSGLPDHLTDDELLSVIGHACGHLQNNHTPWTTALYMLDHSKNLIVKWAARPASLALKGWARRAEITCDRASLLCTRSVDVTVSAMVKRKLGQRQLWSEIDLPEYLRQLDEEQSGPGRYHELFTANPYLPKRVKALRLFAETTYFRSVLGTLPSAENPGLTKEECDAQVTDLLAVLG
jgi:Zn-dependent protease with chaperone function